MSKRSFEFFMHHDCKIEKVYSYRTAVVQDVVAVVRGDDMHKEVERLFKENNERIDNHIVFKLTKSPLWFWYSDGDLRIGTTCLESSY